jgi:choloylglycine hydrolase
MNNRFKLWILIIPISLVLNLFFIHSSQACTVFCIDKGGSLVIGRNEDWDFGEGMVVVNKRNQTKIALRYWNESKDNLARWTSKYGSISFVQYGREIDLGGMNEAGLVVNGLELDETEYPVADACPSLSIDQLIQYILDNFQSVDEISAGIRHIRLRLGGLIKRHYFVTDRMGQSIVIEFLKGKMVIHAKKTMPVKVLTNDTYKRSVNYFKEKEINGLYHGGFASSDRFANAAAMVSKYNPKNSKGAVFYAFNILDTVRMGSCTQFQIVFDVKKRVIYFKSLLNPQLRYFNFDSFDFSPHSGSKILDLNADLAGDVTSKFSDYSTKINEDLIKKAWGYTNIYPPALQLISHYPETFITGSADAAIISTIKTCGRGQLRIIEGIPFLKLYGSYYEMGEQYGSLLKKEIDESYKDTMGLQEWGKLKQRKALFSRLEKPLSPKYIQYLKGIAKGSGKEYNQVLWGAYLALENPTGLDCSSILTKIKNTMGESRLLHGKNLDNGMLTGHNQAFIEFNPGGEFKYVVSENIGYGPCDGMNERGISVSVDDGGQGLRSKYPRNPLLTFKMHDILASTRNLAEVEHQMKNYVCDVGLILITGSETENSGIIFDISYDKIRENPMGSKQHLFVTNNYLSPDLTSPQVLFACPRYQIIDRYMKNGLVQNIDNLIELMSDPGTVYGVNNFRTKHSVIYDLQNKTIYMVFADNYAAWGKWLKYDWKKEQVTVYREPLGESGPVRLKKTNAAKVASIRNILPSGDDQKKLWAELDTYLKQKSIVSVAPGFTIYYENKEGKVDLEVVQPVDKLGPGSRRVKFTTMNPIETACVIQKGPYQTLAMGDLAIKKWIDKNGYKITGPYRRIWLKGDWNEPDPREWLTEIRVPVKKKFRLFDFWSLFHD